MFSEKIEKAFQLMLQAIQLLQQSLDTSFLDAYIENGENILDDFQVRVLDGEPDQETAKQLAVLYDQIRALDLSAEEIRSLTQLVLLKGSREEALQANHQLTPDGIGYLFVYLLEELYKESSSLSILDLAAGMGNLLLTALVNNSHNIKVSGYGVDADDTLLSVFSVNNQWTKADVQLFHQDGAQELLIEPVDAAISDLPIGYYPNDEKAANFQTAAKEGHTYAHHILIEQSMKYVKPDGFGLFLVPSNIMETEQASYFVDWLKEHVYLQAFIQLPDELFRSKESRKSIVILQNKGTDSHQAEEVLLARLTSLKDPQQFKRFVQQFEAWKASNLK